jgi:hypothetical protein
MFPYHRAPAMNFMPTTMRHDQVHIRTEAALHRPAADPLQLLPEHCVLSICQQPKEALVTTEGKEKARKPVDPPPILELNFNHDADPQGQHLQNPYIFVCTSLWKADKDEPYDDTGDKTLAGTLVSSLHRLKNANNKYGAFFVFGDVSVKVQGTFRLHFTMYAFNPTENNVQHLCGATSEKFNVLLPKDFKGMDESTYLSRMFSDQGVRLRLRKEPRGMMGNKRSYPGEDAPPVSNAPLAPLPEDPQRKRVRQDDPALHATPTTASFPYHHVQHQHYPVGQNMQPGASSLYRNINYAYSDTTNLTPIPHNQAYAQSHMSQMYPQFAQVVQPQQNLQQHLSSPPIHGASFVQPPQYNHQPYNPFEPT